jgi:hypothetical protein
MVNKQCACGFTSCTEYVRRFEYAYNADGSKTAVTWEKDDALEELIEELDYYLYLRNKQKARFSRSSVERERMCGDKLSILLGIRVKETSKDPYGGNEDDAYLVLAFNRRFHELNMIMLLAERQRWEKIHGVNPSTSTKYVSRSDRV